jgi:hypothetical protein
MRIARWSSTISVEMPALSIRGFDAAVVEGFARVTLTTDMDLFPQGEIVWM